MALSDYRKAGEKRQATLKKQLDTLMLKRTGYERAPVSTLSGITKVQSADRQLKLRNAYADYQQRMKGLGFTYDSAGDRFSREEKEAAKESSQALLERYKKQDEFDKKSRDLLPLDLARELVPNERNKMDPEILLRQTAAGVRDWQEYDKAMAKIDQEYKDRIYREPVRAEIKDVGEPIPASQQTPEKRTNFFKAVGNSLLAGMISVARHTVSNAPAFMGEASEEDIQKTKDTLQKIVDVTIPKEGQTTKPLWQGAFQRQADRASKMPEATKTLAGVTETIQQAPVKTEKFLRTEEEAARQRADIQNAATITRWMAGAAESLPLSLSTRIPAIGWILMYNTSFRGSLEQSMLDNPNPTAEEGNMIMVKAVADAALEVGTEMIFPLYGSTMATAKGIAKGTIKPTLANATKGLVSFFKKGAVQEAITPTIKNVAKQILKNAAEEGAEEAINYFLGAYVAVLTTEQGKNVWSVKENQESVASVAGLIDATMTGAISGGGIAGARSIVPSSAYYYDKFQNTKQAVDKVGDKTIDQVTAKDAENLNDAIMQDMNNPENATKVTEAVVEAVQKSTVPQQPTTPKAEAQPARSLSETIAYLESNPDMILDADGNITPVSSVMPQKPAQAPASPAQAERVSTPVQTAQAPQQASAETTQAIRTDRVTPLQTGTKAMASISPKESVQTTVSAMAPASITPSMDADTNPVAGYDTALQPRDTSRMGSDVLVEEIASKPNFTELFRVESVQDGIPVIDQRGMVVAGNHRVAGILKMMRDYPQNYKAYKQYARDNADKLGLSATTLRGDFIVTRMLPEGVDAKAIADKTNIPTVRRMSPSELAKRDSGMLDTGMLSLFVPREDGLVNTRDNRAFLNEFASKIMPESELDSYRDSQGNFNTAGISRITNALFYKAYGSTRLLDLIAESTDNDVKRLTTSLLNVAPELVALDAGIKRGVYYALDVAKLLSASGEQWVKMKQDKQNVAMYANQTEMGDTPETIRAKNLLFAMEANKGSAKRLTAFYMDLIDSAKNAGQPGQLALFEQETPTIDSIIEVAKRGGNFDVTETELQPEARSLPIEEIARTAQEPAKPEAKEVKPKAQPEEAVKEPTLTVSMADIERKYTQGASRLDIEQSIESWLDSDDPSAQDIKSIKDGAELAEKLLDLKLDIETKTLDSDTLMKIDLQLLGMDAWARRLSSIPKGDAITMHMKKMVDLFRRGQTQNIKDEINSYVTSDMFLHRIIGDQQIINEATSRMQDGNAQQKAKARANIHANLSTGSYGPVDIIMGDMYAAELNAAGNYHDAIAMSDLVSQRLSETGRLLRSAMLSGKIHGTNIARKMISDFKNQVDPTAEPKIEIKVKETEKIINAAKKGALEDAANTLDKSGLDETIKDGMETAERTQKNLDSKKAIRDGSRESDKTFKPEAGSEEQSLADKFAKKIIAYSKWEQKPPAELSLEQRILKQLMTKFSERNPKDREVLTTNPYAVLADIIANRGEYAEVWEGAQAILTEATQEGQTFEADVATFIDQFLSPTHAVSADKYMKAVIAAQLKASNRSFSDIALDYSMNESVTLSRFFTDLRKAMPSMDANSFEYIKNYMTEYMTKTMDDMNQKRLAKLREPKKQEPKKNKLRNEPQEQLANMMANDIRLQRSETAPKVRSAEEKMISFLYRKHTDYFGKQKGKPQNIYQMLADIVSDRSAYESIWFSARSLLQSYPDLAFSDVYHAMQNFNNPIVAESIMRGVVAQTIKDSGQTVSEVARNYFFDNDLAFKNFFNVLKGRVEGLSDADVKYVYDMFRPYFDKAMQKQRGTIEESLKKQLERKGLRVDNKTSTQQALEKLMNAAFRDELNIPELRDIWAARMGLPHLSQDMVKDIYDTMQKIHSLRDADNIQDEIFQLQKRLSEATPAEFADQVLAWMRAAMLLQPSTWITNGTSNMLAMPIYNTSDRLQYFMEKWIGVPEKERVSGKKFVKIDGSTDIGKVVMEYSTKDKIERHLAKSEKWDLRRSMNVERQYFKNPKINAYVKSVNRVLNYGEIGKIKIAWLGDNKPYTMHFRRSMANTLSALGYSESLPEATKNKMIQDAMSRAADVATIRTFRQKVALAVILNNLSKPIHSAQKIREAAPATAATMKATNTVVKLTSRIIYPFVVTPMALAFETYKFTPHAGIIAAIELGGRSIKSKKSGKPIQPETKARIARQLAQATVGTTVMFLAGMILSALGFIDLDLPDKERDRNAWQLAGRNRYSIYIPGWGSVSLGWLQPLGTAMFMGASVQQAWDGELNWEFVSKMFTEPFNTLVKSTILNDIINPFDASPYRDESQTFLDNLTGSVFMAIPSVLMKFNRIVDPYARDIYKGTGWEKFKNRFLSYVPFGTFAVAPKVDIWGNEIRQSPTTGAMGVLEKTFINFASPFTIRRASKDPITDEIMRVYNESGNADAVPSFPAKSFKIELGGVKVDQDMTGDKYIWYMKESGKISYQKAKELIASGPYKLMTDDEKAAALKKVYDKGKEQARKNWQTLGGKLPD